VLAWWRPWRCRGDISQGWLAKLAEYTAPDAGRMHLKKRREELSAPRSDGCPAGRIMRRPQFPGDIKTDPLWQPVSVGNCVIGDGRSRFEGEWQIRVTPCEASMTDAENVTDATCPDQHEATGAPTRMPSVTCLIVRSRPGAQAIPTPTPACTPPKGTASASSAVTTRAARRSRRLMRFPTSFPGEPAMLPGCQRGDCAVAVRRARSRSDPMPNYVVGL
jgi:hypothetical protein